MEAVKQWPEKEKEAEEVEVEVALERKSFRKQSNHSSFSSENVPAAAEVSNGVQSLANSEGTLSSHGSSGVEDGDADLLITNEGPLDENKIDDFTETFLEIPMQRREQIFPSDQPLDENKIVNFTEAILEIPMHPHLEQVFPPEQSFEDQNLQNTYLSNEITEDGKVVSVKHGDNELYLEKVYEKPATHNFYCPNCNACITKVIIREIIITVPAPPPVERFRCMSCFSFLIPIGSWIFPKWISPVDEVPGQGNQIVSTGGGHQSSSTDPIHYPLDGENVNVPMTDPSVTGTANSKPQPSLPQPEVPNGTTDNDKGNFSENKVGTPYPKDQSNQAASTGKDPSGDKVGTSYPKGPKDQSSPAASAGPVGLSEIEPSKTPKPVPSSTSLPVLEEVIIHGRDTPIDAQDKSKGKNTGIAVIKGTTDGTTPLVASERETKRWEVLKSIVYGGLTESITSLGIVTSAVSAGSSTANIVALALANLIGGLFVVGHNLMELKKERFRRASEQADQQAEQYEQLMGEREHFFLHFSVAIISFLVFGLVPPIVYGFTFYETDDRDLKLAAVAGASLLCITLLAIGKAHTQKPNKWEKYATTALYYVAIGFGVSGLSYLAGDLIGKLIEKLGLFKSDSTPTLLLPQMSKASTAWGSS